MQVNFLDVRLHPMCKCKKRIRVAVYSCVKGARIRALQTLAPNRHCSCVLRASHNTHCRRDTTLRVSLVQYTSAHHPYPRTHNSCTTRTTVFPRSATVARQSTTGATDMCIGGNALGTTPKVPNFQPVPSLPAYILKAWW